MYNSGYNRNKSDWNWITCSNCRTRAQVPFKPDFSRPVYCLSCYNKLKENGNYYSNKNNTSYKSKNSTDIHSLGEYHPKSRYQTQDSFSEKIINFKKGDNIAINDFSKKMVQDTKYLSADIIVPVPSSKEGEVSYGLSRMCRNIADEKGARYHEALTRKKSVQSSHLSSSSSRPTEKDHYDSIFCDPSVRGKRVILVDDITTTGSTIEACKRKLYQFGAKEVIVRTIGKTK